MRKTALFIVFLLFISLSITYVLHPFSDEKKKISVVSPLPDFLTIFVNKQVSTLSLWLPDLDNKVGDLNSKPKVSARSALVLNLKTKQVLYEENPRLKVPMASLTKIMTAVIALENKRKDNQYVVKKEYLVGEDSMGLEEGEILTLEDLLYGLILHSGNDAAETIASNYQGGRSAFIKAMNLKAKSLGLSDTNFTNPTGLEGDGDQHTTAYDLVVITQYALNKFPTFEKISSTFQYTIPRTNTHKEYFLENETNLISSYPGVKGVKTGYTPEAGFCLVTYLDYQGNKLIGVLLGSENRRQEMKDLLDYSLETVGVVPPPHG